MHELKYRRDIDGLRAIAVLSVIIYHISPQWLSGGFVGVDIFFVISGYLITSQIRADIINNKFSYKNFYYRRIRRIVPPLLMMLLACSLVSFILLTPEAIMAYAKSLLVQPLSLQNFVFLAEGDYFIKNDGKPLLHTWSLAVEEQFYLFWPMLLLWLSRRKTNVLMSVVIFLIIVSFYLCFKLTQSNPTLAFYILPTRAWELGLGSILALTAEKNNYNLLRSKGVRVVISWLGFMLIVGSLLVIDSKMRFPGYVALFPTIGTALLILANINDKYSANKVLSNSALVHIGLLSYALYLWHWPILAFMSHLTIDKTAFLSVLAVLLGSYGFSWISFRYVERPVRSGQVMAGRSKELIVFLMGLMLILIVFSIHILISRGASYRYPPQVASFLAAPLDSQTGRCGPWFVLLNPRGDVCDLTPNVSSNKRILLWGNSHSDGWSYALKNMAISNNAKLYLNRKNCSAHRFPQNCSSHPQDRIIKFIVENHISDVILASAWPKVAGDSAVKYEAEIVALIDRLAQLKVKVWMVVDVPASDEFDPINAFKKNPQSPKVASITLDQYRTQSYDLELSIYKNIASKRNNAYVVDIMPAFCGDSQCYGGRASEASEIWYRDASHISNTGATMALPYFKKVFESSQ